MQVPFQFPDVLELPQLLSRYVRHHLPGKHHSDLQHHAGISCKLEANLHLVGQIVLL